MENHMAVDFITTGKLGYAMENNCVGVYVLNEATGVVETLRSDVTVLATGGCGKVYLYTTNPDIATGDGVAMAWSSSSFIQPASTTKQSNPFSSLRLYAARVLS
jgi:L-aspartate oxidase